MIKHLHIILLVAALWLGCGCTHNNGDIGPLFGSWVLDEMTVDGVPEAFGEEYTVMQFQGEIVMTKLIDDRHSLLGYSVGTWIRHDDVLDLNYTHHDDESEYRTPEWLLLTHGVINTMVILSLDSRHMHLQHTTPDGRIVQYKFRKTH